MHFAYIFSILCNSSYDTLIKSCGWQQNNKKIRKPITYNLVNKILENMGRNNKGILMVKCWDPLL